MQVSVIIPTFRRPDGLRRAARSVIAQNITAPFALIIVDNDPAASGAEAAKTIAAEAPAHLTVTYLHEPQAGVANARNTAMAHVATPLVLFLDDDQSVGPNWLANWLAFHAQFPAAASFGAVETVLPEGVTRHVAYLKRFFARADRRYADGLLELEDEPCADRLEDRRRAAFFAVLGVFDVVVLVVPIFVIIF